MYCFSFWERKTGIRDTDEKRAGRRILVKKEQDCGIRTPPFQTIEYEIQLPVGAYVRTEIEHGGKDPNEILCLVPDDLGDFYEDQTMSCRSLKKSYKVCDVVGKPIAQVQYFLSETFTELLKNGRVQTVEG